MRVVQLGTLVFSASRRMVIGLRSSVCSTWLKAVAHAAGRQVDMQRRDLGHGDLLGLFELVPLQAGDVRIVVQVEAGEPAALGHGLLLAGRVDDYLPGLELERLLVPDAPGVRIEVVVLRVDEVAALRAADFLLQLLELAALAWLGLPFGALELGATVAADRLLQVAARKVLAGRLQPEAPFRTCSAPPAPAAARCIRRANRPAPSAASRRWCGSSSPRTGCSRNPAAGRGPSARSSSAGRTWARPAPPCRCASGTCPGRRRSARR